MNFIQLSEIKKSYLMGSIEVPVLRGVSLEIHKGEYIALMGSSGSGKSTLMNILGFLDRPSSGRYFLEGRDVSAIEPDDRARLRSAKIGFVFQNFSLLPRTSALQNIMMPLEYVEAPPSTHEAKSRAEALLTRVGLSDRFHHEPWQLSGGQQQRVAIARALINQPQLLLADEPTGNLDSSTTQEILSMFDELNHDEGITIVMVTHEDEVASRAKRVIRLKDGMVIS